MNQYTNYRGRLSASLAMIDSIDERDGCGHGHSRRVSLLTARLAEASGASPDDTSQAALAGLLHDVGKCMIPACILAKPGRLTDEESAIVRRHPRLGYELLSDVPGLEAILPAVLHHHERYDGKGYPSGLGEGEIPRLARLLCITDAFDAMTSFRCYSVPLTCDDALTELKSQSGRQFDPELVEAFLTLDLGEYTQDVESLRLVPQRRAA